MMPRAELRRSAAIARAFAVAMGAHPGRDWYEAQADHEEDVDELMRKGEADRAAAEWLSGRR
jgi:NaMN:DMB phosphoribosyltransferase